MDIIYQTLLSAGIPSVAIIWVGIIIHNQLATQKKIIENYKGYIEATDWKRVKEHYDEIVIPQAVAKAEKAITEQVESEVAELNPLVDSFLKQHKELLTYAIHTTMFFVPSKATAEKMINEKLPSLRQEFERVLDWFDTRDPDGVGSHLRS